MTGAVDLKPVVKNRYPILYIILLKVQLDDLKPVVKNRYPILYIISLKGEWQVQLDDL